MHFEAIDSHKSQYLRPFQPTLDDLRSRWEELQQSPGPNMIEVRISTGSRGDLGRPESTPLENKKSFMNWISNHRF